MSNTTKTATTKTTEQRTAAAARKLAKAITAIRKEDPELARWLSEDASRSIQRFREIRSGLALPVA